MNIISCDHCGVLLDKSKLSFTKEEHFDNSSNMRWSNEKMDWVPYAICLVCREEILDEDY